jgi:hypothetical protein
VYLFKAVDKEIAMQWIRIVRFFIVLPFVSLVVVRDLGAKGSLFVPAPTSPIAVDGAPADVVFSDVNQDGHVDLVVAIDEPSVIVLLGRGDGTFQGASGKHLILPAPPSEMASGDLNDDGHPDLAITSHDSYDVMLALGNGEGGFSLSSHSPIIMKQGEHPHTHGLGIGDLNGDGSLDLVTANNEDNDISVALNNGQGEFVPASTSPFAVEPEPYPLTLGDVNNDGFLDIIASSTQRTSRSMTILLGDGQGDFESVLVSVRTAQPWFPAIGDVNGDGNPDFVTTHWERDELTVMLGDGSGHFEEMSSSPFNLGYNAWETAVADINADGRADILTASGNGIGIMLGNGNGQLVLAPGSPVPTEGGSWRFALGDVNGDGKLDIATPNLESHSVTILLAEEG